VSGNGGLAALEWFLSAFLFVSSSSSSSFASFSPASPSLV